MRSIQEISDDIDNAFESVIEVFMNENKDNYIERFESTTKEQEQFEKELKDYVISIL